MTSAFFITRKIRTVGGLLLITISVFAFCQMDSSGQGREQSPAKLRKHPNAKVIANRYIVVLRDEAVDFTAREAAVAEIGDSLSASYGAQIERTYKHALNGYAIEMTEAQALALSRDPRVAYVEEDVEVSVEPVTAEDNPQENAMQYNSQLRKERDVYRN